MALRQAGMMTTSDMVLYLQAKSVFSAPENVKAKWPLVRHLR
jgi:hypothetical protein